MSVPTLSFDVLAQISPILTWVEGGSGARLPTSWAEKEQPFAQRERDWLLGELPTYSHDNIEELVQGFRAPAKPRLKLQASRSLSPPDGFDLLRAFRRLNQHFFVWNGTELCVRENRMEELHELALRFPAGHIVRHAHGRAVSEGVLSTEEAIALPELVSLLPSNSFGLRSAIRRGLSESHLHLKGVTSAEESWVDGLLRPVHTPAIGGVSSQERRLLLLNLFAGRLLSLAVLASNEPGKLANRSWLRHLRPWELLQKFDRLYFAASPHEERIRREELRLAIIEVVYGRAHQGEEKDHRTILSQVPEKHMFLLRWMAPTGLRVWNLNNQRTLPGGVPEDHQARNRFLYRLHLEAHHRLIQLSARTHEETRDSNVVADRKLDDPETLHSDPDTEASPRHFLHEALFRYMICRTYHWQQATQQGHTTGLRHFRDFYASKQRRLSYLSRQQNADLTFQRLDQWRGLRVLEGRVAPPATHQDLVPWIRAFARPELDRIQKFGMVVHFKKQAEATEEPRFDDPKKAPVVRLRWGKRRRLIWSEAVRLYNILQSPTPVNPFIVGIDACNLELSTPPEVFAPVFRFLRDLPIVIRREDWRFSPFRSLENEIRHLVSQRRLGMTYHVGEDFRHLLSGLRAIHEVVEFLGPQPGDRLGHGTALALEPRQWLEHNGYQAILPRLEWLDTLVWVHHFLGPGDEIVGELALEERIQRHSWTIYSHAISPDGLYDPLHLSPSRPDEIEYRGPERRRKTQPPRSNRGLLDWDWSPHTLWDAWNLRQLDPYVLDRTALLKGSLRMQKPKIHAESHRRWYSVQENVLRRCRRRVGSKNAALLLGLYWMSPIVRTKGAEVILVDMYAERDKWLELCRRVGQKMEATIHKKELVVEVNPSANRLIGPMSSYRHHHVFQLTLDEERRLQRRVRVSVNTDNPAVCNTTLAHEYYLLGEILMAEGIPEAEVVKWLEWLRENGNEYNFVRRIPGPKSSPAMGRLVEWIRQLRPSVLEARSRDEKHNAFWEWTRARRLRSASFTVEDINNHPGLVDRLARLESIIRSCGARVDNQTLSELQIELDRLKAQVASHNSASHNS